MNEEQIEPNAVDKCTNKVIGMLLITIDSKTLRVVGRDGYCNCSPSNVLYESNQYGGTSSTSVAQL